MNLSKRTWWVIAAVLAVGSVNWLALGLLVNAIPTASTGTLEDIKTSFELTRACCLAPTMAGLLLAYLAFVAGRRGSGRIEAYELIAALGAAASAWLMLTGLAVIAEPTGSETLATRVAFGGLFVLPGLVLLALALTFSYWMRGRR